ncbi:MAG: metal-dependent transcriptional regulator [Spirochaetia bacterium]
MLTTSDDVLPRLTIEFPAAADYLSTILLIKRDYDAVHNTRLASRLGVSKPAVSQAVSRLKQIGLLEQDSYGVIELTGSGRAVAEKIIRRHYLIEHLLIRTVRYPWEKADAEALRLQTMISDDLADHLHETFDRPSVCPHGNPFPGSEGEAELLRAPRLVSCLPGTTAVIVRITEEGEAVDGLLRYCHAEGIQPGTELHIEAVVPETAVRVTAPDKKIVDIPWEIAVHICVSE